MKKTAEAKPEKKAETKASGKKRVKFELYADVNPTFVNAKYRSKTALKKAMSDVLKSEFPNGNVVIRTTTEDY